MDRNCTRRHVLEIGAATIATGALGGVASGSKKASTARFAAFNVIDLRAEQVQMPGDEQAEAAARVIQEIRPDVLVVNELANNLQQEGENASSQRSNIDAFVENYLSVPQRDHLEGIEYPYTLQPPSNTGVLPADDFDFNNDGDAGQRPGDAFGYGHFPGHYAFAIASRYPIETDAIRSFQTFNWADMPNNLIPMADDPAVDPGAIYLTEAEAEVYRLSSKTHIDVPLQVEGETIHGLFAHPTPPGFDGANNFNGRWNHDEVRFLADYVADADYIYDDSGTAGGLDASESFVLMGDMNAAPEGGRPLDPATKFLFDNENFNTRRLPTSPGGANRNNPYATRYSDYRGVAEQIDYVLPSADLSIRDSSVVWPGTESATKNLGEDVETASDHRIVWVDVDP